MRVTPLLEGITLPSHTGAHIISCSDFPCQFAALPGGFSVFIAGCKKSCNLSITAHFWRRVRDLNPRDAHHAYTISNRAPSTTQPTLHMVAEEGFEPSQTESESVVLPLHNSALSCATLTVYNIQRELSSEKCKKIWKDFLLQIYWQVPRFRDIICKLIVIKFMSAMYQHISTFLNSSVGRACGC